MNLERLHLRDNPLSDLTGFTSSNLKLKYLNIRECRIIEVEEIKNLSVLSGLRELIVKENYFDPEHRRNFEYGRIEEEGEGEEEEEEEEVEEEEEQLVSPQSKDELEEENNQIRIQILSYLPKLKRIDKKLVTKQELEIMRELMDDEDIQL